MSVRLLFVEISSDMSITEVYNRLLSIIVPGIEYIRVINDNIIQNAILVVSHLDDYKLLSEISEILPTVGFRGKYKILKDLQLT